MKLLVGLLLFAAPLLPGEGNRARALLGLERLLDDGRGRAALQEFLRLQGEGAFGRTDSDVRFLFSSRGYFDEAEELLDQALLQDPHDRWRPYLQGSRADLHALAGEYENALAAYEAIARYPSWSAEHHTGLLVHMGRHAEALELLRDRYDLQPTVRDANRRMEVALSQGHVDLAIAFASPEEGQTVASNGGGCYLAMQSEQSRRAHQLASVLLAAGHPSAASQVERAELDAGWLDLVTSPPDPTPERTLVRQTLRLDPGGLPHLWANEDRALAHLARADAFEAWETHVGRAVPAVPVWHGATAADLPGCTPSRGLRLAALARLLDVPGGAEHAASHLGGPDDLHALRALALMRADGVLTVLARRIAESWYQRDPRRLEALVRAATLHGTPEAYARLRALAADAPPDLARAIRRVLWRNPPWRSPTWRTDFLEDAP